MNSNGHDVSVTDGFVLTREWRDSRRGIELDYWLVSDSGPLHVVIAGQEAVFFLVRHQRAYAAELLRGIDYRCVAVALRDFSLADVDAYYFSRQRTLRQAKDLLTQHELFPCEADLRPHDRFLMERFVRGSVRLSASPTGKAPTRSRYPELRDVRLAAGNYHPRLKVVSLDIETAIDGLALYSIALYAREGDNALRKVFMVSAEPVGDDVLHCADEAILLRTFLAWLADYDPDVIIGWNVINFDIWYLQRIADQHGMELTLGRDGGRVQWRELDSEGYRKMALVSGRVILDGIDVLRTATYQFESFSLAAVAGEVLGDSKLASDSDRGELITEWFLTEKPQLAAYNLQDCKLVWDIFVRLDLIAFVIARARLTGLPLDRVGGSVAAFDFHYLPLLHRRGFVAPHRQRSDEIEHSPGGLVMNSRPGIYEHVLVFDFKSLYPSIIRSFMIDPLAMAVAEHERLDQSQLVPGFNGAWFAREYSILPGVIEELWRARDAAKAKADTALSQAIKIMMNSFYGVLGTPGCRFFDARLTSSITRRGHQIIRRTAELIEHSGWKVIYGDTDSVFVWMRGALSGDDAVLEGQALVDQLNQWWRDTLRGDYAVDSALEIEFETHFKRFLMPTIRGTDLGSKKRYAGIVSVNGEDRILFKGLENVRSDWTRLARDFQAELYRRVFYSEPYADYVKETVRAVMAGERDEELVYRKRLRRPLKDYQRTIPPHVQAAKKWARTRGEVPQRGDWVEYVITVNGAEPRPAVESPIDYQHYIDRQLKPVADGILLFLDDSFDAITAPQIDLF